MKSTVIAIAALVAITSSATQYSCLSIVTETKRIGKWDALKAWIGAAGYADEWSKCSYVSDDYPQYADITNAIVSAGVMTSAEIAEVLARSVDTAISDALFVSMYRRDMSNENGRAKWHGKLVTVREDWNNLVQTLTYADGYIHRVQLKKRSPMTTEQRFALAEKRRLAKLPPGLRAVERRRAENAAKTNEVTVIYTPKGIE